MQKGKKKFFLFGAFVIIFFLLMLNSIVKLWSYVFDVGNVNKNYLAVDTVWYNPENCYHNDVLNLIRKILLRKLQIKKISSFLFALIVTLFYSFLNFKHFAGIPT